MTTDIIWKPIEGFEGLYEINNIGEVRSLPREYSYYDPRWNNIVIRKHKGSTMKSGKTPAGYRVIPLRKDGRRYCLYIHRLVAQTFIPNPEDKPEVNHKDRNKDNNSVDNLEWVTAKENSQHLLHSDYDWGAAHRGRHLTLEHKQKLSKFFKGRKHANHRYTQNSLNKLLQSRGCQPVRCVTDNKSFRSASNAARYYKCDPITVLRSIRNNKPTRSGLHFEYMDMKEYYHVMEI